MDVDAVAVEEAAVVLSDADDLVAPFHHQLGSVRAHVAEALDDHAAAFALHVQIPQGLVADHGDAAAGSLTPSARSADVQRLSRDHSGHRLPHMHGVGVHDPGHGLLVGVDVRGGNVLLWADKLDQFRGVAAGHAFQLADGHLLGVADHAALGAAERDVDHGALPRHPTGQRANLIQGDVGGIADSALARTARNRVLHPEAGEDLDASVVHHHRDVHDHFACRVAQHLPQPFIQVKFLCSKVKSSSLGFPGINFLLERYGLHNQSPDMDCIWQSSMSHRG